MYCTLNKLEKFIIYMIFILFFINSPLIMPDMSTKISYYYFPAIRIYTSTCLMAN